MQQEAEPVVVEVAESVSDSLDLLDEQVDRFGGAVGHAAGVEVGQQFWVPGVDGAGQPGEFGDVGVGAVGQPPIQVLLGAFPVRAGEDQPQVLGGATYTVPAQVAT